MTEDKLSFADALKEAQALGYAEADPTLDIEGIDTAHKLAIASAIAFGTPIQFDRVHIEGISGIDPLDIQYAEEFGYQLKLLAIARNKERPAGDAGPPDTHCAETRACQREGRLQRGAH